MIVWRSLAGRRFGHGGGFEVLNAKLIRLNAGVEMNENN